MTSNLLSKAGEYRETANRVRRLAAQMRFAEYRAQLLNLADGFDRLAARVEVGDSNASRPAATASYVAAR